MHEPAHPTFKAVEAGMCTYLGLCSVCLICFIHKFDVIGGCLEAECSMCMYLCTYRLKHLVCACTTDPESTPPAKIYFDSIGKQF